MQDEVTQARNGEVRVNRLSLPARVLGVPISALAGVVDGRVRTPAPVIAPRSGPSIGTDDPEPTARAA